MHILRLVGVAVGGGWLSEYLGQPPQAGDAQDINVVVAAKRLDQSEVNLQCDVVLVLLVSSEDTQHHAVRIAEQEKYIATLILQL